VGDALGYAVQENLGGWYVHYGFMCDWVCSVGGARNGHRVVVTLGKRPGRLAACDNGHRKYEKENSFIDERYENGWV